MILPKGITGFGKPITNVKNLSTKTLLDELFQRIQKNHYFKLKEFKNPENSTNYYKLILLDNKNNELKILINSIFPFYCGVIDYEWMQLQFVDLPQKVHSMFGELFFYTPITVLNQKVNIENIVNLDKYEINQINYWESQTIGEIIFNGYD